MRKAAASAAIRPTISTAGRACQSTPAAALNPSRQQITPIDEVHAFDQKRPGYGSRGSAPLGLTVTPDHRAGMAWCRLCRRCHCSSARPDSTGHSGGPGPRNDPSGCPGPGGRDRRTPRGAVRLRATAIGGPDRRHGSRSDHAHRAAVRHPRLPEPMAQEFGDHPDAAADRVRWICQLTAQMPAWPQRPAGAGCPGSRPSNEIQANSDHYRTPARGAA